MQIKKSKKECEETGGIQTWTEIFLLLGRHSNHWAIGNLDVRYKILRHKAAPHPQNHELGTIYPRGPGK